VEPRPGVDLVQERMDRRQPACGHDVTVSVLTRRVYT
jgi:hypothetical protein